MPDRPRYLLTLEARDGPPPPAIRLRRLLKLAGRHLGFRVVRVEELSPGSGTPPISPAEKPLTPTE